MKQAFAQVFKRSLATGKVSPVVFHMFLSDKLEGHMGSTIHKLRIRRHRMAGYQGVGCVGYARRRRRALKRKALQAQLEQLMSRRRLEEDVTARVTDIQRQLTSLSRDDALQHVALDEQSDDEDYVTEEGADTSSIFHGMQNIMKQHVLQRCFKAWLSVVQADQSNFVSIPQSSFLFLTASIFAEIGNATSATGHSHVFRHG